jgi:DNA-binding GntR family transcriptional regulator
MARTGLKSMQSARGVALSWVAPAPSLTQSLAEQIAEKVGQAVIRGEYRPGERIQEQTLADLFQVSRGPVREALRILEK